MKKIILVIIVLAVIAAGLIFAFKQMSGEREAEMQGEAPVTAASQIKRAADGAVIISLDGEAQKRINLQTATLAPGTLAREVKAYGRVLDPAPLASLLAELTSTRAAVDASKKEFQRLKLLYEQGENASKRAVETAEVALQRDQIAADAAHLKLVSSWGRAVAEQPDFPAFVTALATQQALLVRLDLPAGQASAAPQGARLLALDAPEQPIAADYLGPAADVDAQAQGQGFLFLVNDGRTGLRPGQALIGFIQQPGAPLSGLVVPASAVIRAAGKAWVYLHTGETNFTRRDFTLEHPTAGGWLVPRGLTAQDRIVVTGAQLLFSEELKSRIQVGE